MAFITRSCTEPTGKMENCEIHSGSEHRTFATKNVTVSALVSVFGIDPDSTCWLKDLGDTYVFPDENGCFPTLEGFGMYDIEIGAKQKRAHQSSDESDEDLLQSAFQLAGSKKGRKKSSLGGKGKGKRAVPSSRTTEQPEQGWYFKVTIGAWSNKKIMPQKNCLLKCTQATSCSAIKEGVARDLMVPPSFITLYDSDYLEISDSPGRVGK